MSLMKLAMAGRRGVLGAAVAGFPAVVEVVDVAVGELLVGEEDVVGLGGVLEEAAVVAEAVAGHFDGEAGGGEGGEAGVVVEGVVVAEPEDLVGGVGDGRAAVGAAVEEALDVLLGVGEDVDAVGAEGPDLALSGWVAID